MTAPMMLDPAALSEADRAAVMVMLLEEDQAAQILARLEPGELRLLGEKMCALGEIGPEVIAHAIAGFVEKTERLGLKAHDRLGQVRSLMTRAVGDVRAGNLMQRILPPDHKPPSPLELAKWLNPEALVPLIREEHPQAVADVLFHFGRLAGHDPAELRDRDHDRDQHGERDAADHQPLAGERERLAVGALQVQARQTAEQDQHDQRDLHEEPRDAVDRTHRDGARRGHPEPAEEPDLQGDPRRRARDRERDEGDGPL